MQMLRQAADSSSGGGASDEGWEGDVVISELLMGDEARTAWRACRPSRPAANASLPLPSDERSAAQRSSGGGGRFHTKVDVPAPSSPGTELRRPLPGGCRCSLWPTKGAAASGIMLRGRSRACICRPNTASLLGWRGGDKEVNDVETKVSTVTISEVMLVSRHLYPGN